MSPVKAHFRAALFDPRLDRTLLLSDLMLPTLFLYSTHHSSLTELRD
jgi:hypothetical protein